MTTKRLRVVAIAVPLVYLLTVEALSIFFLVPLMGHSSVGRLLTVGAILVVGTVPFTIWLFARHERLVLMVRAMAERQQLEAMYRAIFEATGDGLVIYTMDGVMVEVNPAFCAMNGYTREELIGRNVTMLIDPEYHNLYREFVRTVAQGGSMYTWATNVRKDGTSFPVDVHGTVLPYDGTSHILGVARDVTDTVRAYELLEERVEERTQELSTALAKEAAIAVENARLYREVRATRDRLQQWTQELEAEVAARTKEIERSSRELTTRVLQAQERERQRISRELHDDTAQSLSTLLINLDFLERHLLDDRAVVTEGLDRVRDIAKRTLDEVRAIAHALRPSILDDLGLVTALRWCAREHTGTFGVPVEVKAEQMPAGRLAPELELTFFRMAQEALMNSGKHALAQHAALDLSFPEGTVQLVVEDDGQGFDPGSLKRPTRSGGLGLHGMQERADLIGATVGVRSTPGAGTRVTMTAPLWIAEVEPVAAGRG